MHPREQKTRLRHEMLAQRRSLPEEYVRAASAGILARLEALPVFQQATPVLTYRAFDNEVDTLPLVERLIASRREVYTPKCLPGRQLGWGRVDDLGRLSRNHWGVLEPRYVSVNNCFDGCAVLIIPGLAFSPKGGRRGYGQGYFDRFVASFAGKTVGIAYDFQVVEEMPAEPHDQPIDLLVTQEHCYFTRDFDLAGEGDA